MVQFFSVVLACLVIFTNAAQSSDEIKGQLFVKYEDFKGQGCELKPDDQLEYAALYLDKWIPYSEKSCTGCTGIKGQKNLQSTLLALEIKDIPSASSSSSLHFRFYGLHSIYRAHQYQTKIKIDQDFVAKLKPFQYNRIEMDTYIFNDKNQEVKSPCKLILNFMKIKL